MSLANEQLDHAISLIDEERYGEAIELLSELRRMSPASPLLLAKLGYSLWQLGRLPAAEECFREGVRLRPKSEPLSLGLFHTLWEQDKQTEALNEAKRFLAIAPCDDYVEIVREINSKTSSITAD